MAEKEILHKQLLDTITSMKQEGLVDDHFTFISSLKESNGDPFYLSDMIPGFCSDARDVLNLLTQALNDPILNYNLMREYTFKVKGSASSIGACRMALAFAKFERATAKASKEECLMALIRAQREYSALEAKLHVVLQLERRIILSTPQRTNLQVESTGCNL